MLADMVTCGSRVADVGCDHGFLSIYLVQTGVCPRVLAMDVRKGPLENAREHIEARGLGDYIETRLSDGLSACGAEEADAVVCAGMGGRLMERILRSEMYKVRQMRELILQPQSEQASFRRFLRQAGLAVVREGAVYEDGKYYFAMKAVPSGMDQEENTEKPDKRQEIQDDAEGLYDLYGRQLLLKKDPVLEQYLLERREQVQELARLLAKASSARARERLLEMERELLQIRRALEYFN